MAKKKKESTQDKLVNLQAATLAAQVSNWAAQLEFSKERFRLLELPQYQQMSQLEIDKLAWQKAQDTWERAFQEASMTGTYNGQPTIQWLTEQARMTGVLNGQETLEGKLTNAQITQMQQEMNLRNQQHLLEIGKFDWAKELEGKQFELQKEAQEAAITGYSGGRKTLEREQFEAEQGQKYLSLLSSLQGPSNAFRQLRAIQGGERTGMSRYGQDWLNNFGQNQGQGQFSPDKSQPQLPTGFDDITPGPSSGGGAPPPGAAPISNPSIMQSGAGFTQDFESGPAMSGTGANASMSSDFSGGSPSIMQSGTAAGVTPALAIPGRGFSPDQWNDATRAAVAQWEAQHPGYKADGSQQGWAAIDPALANTPPGGSAPVVPPVPTTPAVPPVPATPTYGGAPMPQMPAYQPGASYDPVSGLMVADTPQLTPEEQQAAQYAGVTAEQYMALNKLFAQNRQPTQPAVPPQPVTKLDPYYGGSTMQPGALANEQMTPLTGVLPKYGATTQESPLDMRFTTGQDAVRDKGVVPAGESQSIMQPVSYSTQQMPQQPGYLLSDEGQQAPLDAYNYQFSQSGQEQVYPPGVKAPADYKQISTNTPVPQSQARTMYSSLDPRQMNAQAYNASNPYAQKMAWAAFEDMGWDTEAAQGEFQASLPKYGGPVKGKMVGGFR